MLTTWPDPELLVRAWLVPALDGVNVTTQTDSTFGTSTPNAWMTLPLVLVQAVPGAGADLYSATAQATVDVVSFAADKPSARALAQQAHSRMVQIIGADTTKGVADDLLVDAMPALVNYSNPDVTRYVATYSLSLRAQAA